MVLPRFIEAAKKDFPVVIYGNGEQKRSFTHVLDVIDAVMLIAFNVKTVGEVYNIGNPNEISIIDLAKKIIENVKSKSKIEFLDYKHAYGENFEDMERRFPNIKKVSDLGWRPKRNLDSIIEDIISEYDLNRIKPLYKFIRTI
jgi:UDP-glucose 4-epimerase